MTRAPGVLSAGRLYADLVFAGLDGLPTLGTETYAQDLSLHTGGGAFITAAHMAALGRPVALAATVPAEPFGTLVRAEIAAAGVDSSRLAPAPPGLAPQITAVMATDQDRAFLTRRTGPAVPPVASLKLDQGDLAHLHIGELATLVECPELLAAARTAGLTVSLDCGWDESVFTPEAARLIGAVDLFLPNAAEAQALHTAGLPFPFAPITVVKCGAEGARVHAEGGEISRPAHPTEVRDTTGAGDAFNGGFLNAWLQGQTLAACLDAGNACGARAVTQPGGATALYEGQPGARAAS